MSPDTIKAYRIDLRQFVDFTEDAWADKDTLNQYIKYLNDWIELPPVPGSPWKTHRSTFVQAEAVRQLQFELCAIFGPYPYVESVH